MINFFKKTWRKVCDFGLWIKSKSKKIVSFVFGATALAAGIIGGIDISTENIREEANRYSQELDIFYEKATEIEKPYIQAVNNLIRLRAKGKEPNYSKWIEVESSIDQIRATNDSEILQKLDRFIETMDATQKQTRDNSIKKISDYENN